MKKDVLLGHMPMMLGSSRCWLSEMGDDHERLAKEAKKGSATLDHCDTKGMIADSLTKLADANALHRRVLC